MSTRGNSRPAAGRRATAARRFTPYSLYRRALRIEPLEDRRLLAVVTVNTLSDTTDLNDNLTTFREAIFATNLMSGADTIDFAPALTAGGPASIVLTQGELKITDSLTINGPGANLLTIDASGSDPTPGIVNGDGSGVFNIDDGAATASIVSISSLKLTGGEIAANGGAVFTRESLSLIDMVIDKNFSTSTNSVGAGGGVAAVLNGGATLIISHSVISNNQSTARGGGISLDVGSSASVLVSHSQIVGNSNWLLGSQATNFAGGGIYISNPFSRGVVTIENSVVFGNRSDGSGGGIAFSGPLTIQNSTIASNSSLGLGGAIYSQGSSFFSKGLTLADSGVTDNLAGYGGGIAIGGLRGPIHSITRSTISRNMALNQYGRGGGVYVQQGDLQIADSTISENFAVSDGGGIFSTSILLERTTVSHNVASNGGGLNVLEGVIRDTTISGNSAKLGGGLFAGDRFGGVAAPGTTVVSHSTIANNRATADAGGVYVGATILNIDHSIVAQNASPSSSDDLLLTRSWPIIAAYSLIGDNSGSGLAEAPIGTPDANGNLIGGQIHGAIDPLLGPLADNGGPTFTHALLPGSPAINAGDLSAAAGVNGVPQFDQRGTPFGRVYNGRIDIGAFEYQQPSDLNLLVDTLVDENDGNYARGDLSLREAIALANTWPSVDTIHFDTALTASSPATILLTLGELKITSSMSIVGLGANLLTIDAKGNDPTPNSVNGDGSRVFNIDDGVATASIITISGLTLTGGQIATDGGAVFTRESLALVDTVIDKNFSTSLSTTGTGGGLAAVLRDGALLAVVRSQITNNQSTVRGAGMLLDVGAGSYVLISGTQVVGNSKRFPQQSGSLTSFAGGGVYIVNAGGTVTIDDSRISDNISDGNGGGISFSGTLTIQHSTIADNSTRGYGGGVHFRASTGGGLSLFDSMITDNEAGSGGGVALSGSNTSASTIARSRFAGNSAERQSTSITNNGSGGGIYFEQGSLHITDSTIRENSADVDGGGIYTTSTGSSTSSFLMEGSTVAFNNAATNGGGLKLGRAGTIRNSTVTGNTARIGGGIYASAAMTIEHSTIVQNEASTTTGGVSAGLLTLSHSIVALNTSPATTDDVGRGTRGQVTAVWSLIGDNIGSGLSEAPIGSPDASGNLIGGAVHGLIDPLLRPLANYGGLTPTFALSVGSPAINAGDPNAAADAGTVPLFDQRGMYFPRVVARRIDIGAFEFHSPPGPTLIVDTLVDESDGNYAAGDLSLREALQLVNLDADENTIQFSPALTAGGPATILLTRGALEIVGNVSIIGPDANLLTVDASGNDPTPGIADGLGSSIFEIGDSTDDLLDVSISGLTLTGGDSQYGGAILSTENLTITGSVITGNHAAQLGGGLAVLYGSVQISDCIISENSTDGTGGGIDSSSAELVVEGCTIDDNVAAVGGGIHAYDSLLSVSNSSVDNNQAIGGGGAGGGIYHKGRKLTVADSTISGNTSISGGGVYSDGEAEIVRSTLDGNYSYLHGGGIYSFGKLTVRETTINGSSTGLDGAGIHVAGDVLVDSSTLNDNDAGRYGGAIWIEVVDGTFTIINSTISGNHADNDAGGIWITGVDATATIAHSTIAGNSSNHLFGFGGGVVLTSGSLELDHTIVIANAAKTGPDIFTQLGTQLVAHYSLIGSAQDTSLTETAVGLPDANGNLIGGPIHGVIGPLLGPLADNGGPTFTHALLAGSPAINAGSLNAVAGVNGVPEFDQRGTPFGRVFNGRIDIGAFEYQQASDLNLLVDTLVDENDGNYSRGDLSLREAIALANMWPSVDTIHFDPALTTNGPAKILLTQGELKITSSMSIIGLGADVLSIDASGNDPTPGVNDGKGSRVFNINDGQLSSTINVTLNGLTLAGGDVIGGGGAITSVESLTLVDSTIRGNSAQVGGGIYSRPFGNGGKLTITRSVIQDNSSAGSGGGIRADAKVTITESMIQNNSAGLRGGGLYFDGGQVEVTDSVVSHNKAVEGGGMYIRANTTSINRTSIRDNDASRSGGGISANGSLVVTDSTITGNSANGSFTTPAIEGGGGIAVSGNLVIAGTTISANLSTGSGGGILAFGTLTISDCTINDNSAMAAGGGILSFGNLAVTNSKIGGNSASGGGGISASGELVVTNSAISNNSANGNVSFARHGGGIYTKGSLQLTDCTITDNTSVGSGGGINSRSSSVIVVHSTIANNQSTNGGAGIFASTSELIIRESQITGNVLTSNKGVGGGIYFSDYSAGNGRKFEITNSTVAGNVAPLVGGGIAARSANGISRIVNSEVSGNTSLSELGPRGAGLYLFGYGTTTIESSNIHNNSVNSIGRGGGIFSAVNLRLNNTTVASNFGGIDGGGILSVGNLWLTDSTVTQNAAANSAGGGGIAMTSLYSVQITGSTISNNLGSGIRQTVGYLTIFTSVISGNSTSGSGGGIYTGDTVTNIFISQSEIRDNHAVGSGGGIYKSAGELVVMESTIASNTAGANGGGVASLANQDSYTSSTISGNEAAINGGGVWANAGQTFAYSTIALNKAGGAGGGVFLTSGNSVAKSTILARNTASTGVDVTGLLGAQFEAHFSLIGSNQGSGLAPAPVGSPDSNGNLIGGSSVNNFIDPNLAPLANNGGLTRTHLLLAGSPAINAGDPLAFGAPVSDQRGVKFNRVVGGRIDIGAVEEQPAPLVGDYNFNGIVDSADFVVWRNTVGATGNLAADGNDDGRIDNADYQLWRANFGITRPALGSSASIQPAAMTAASPLNVNVVVTTTSDSQLAQPLAVRAPLQLVTSPDAKRRHSIVRAEVALERRASGLLAWLADRNAAPKPHQSASEHVLPSHTSTECADTDIGTEAADEAFATLFAAGKPIMRLPR